MPFNPRAIKALLIDLSGTLHIGKELTPRAAEAVERLRNAGVPFLFCSNSTKESEARLLGTLASLGLHASPGELLTSLGACRLYVESRGLRPYLLLSPEAAEEFADLPSCAPAHDAVVVGLYPPAFSYDSLNTAFRVLKREPLYSEPESSARHVDEGHTGATALSDPTPAPSGTATPTAPVLVAPHLSSFQQNAANEAFPAGLSLGVGAYVRALASAASVDPVVVGKPSRGFFELALSRLGQTHGVQLDPHSVVIVGDDAVNDLGAGAIELGLQRVLVRTGKYRPGSEETSPPPDAVYDSFADLVDAILASS
ncbi:Haloacid dehalogenase-like hydrolase domain-containing protein 2 [Vanrija pseudolonga]|uniref:Haloacid dehalogenase-like hydrolase domain-containing protein 2 n=1 Tax=Vanrija pseudolonga TaxID=143232 RepID=A0AAF0YED3_9TREE|nr:Haloacid dehalogenase-like hydrolase domain-containing protein 2 [Vanrija pseudolonga]